MCKFCKKSVKLFSMVVGILFVVYFWNLDQKVLGWAYKQVNAMFDRKPVDIKFCFLNKYRRMPHIMRRYAEKSEASICLPLIFIISNS